MAVAENIENKIPFIVNHTLNERDFFDKYVLVTNKKC